MLASKRDRRLVMDLDAASISPIHSRKSSLSFVDRALPPSTHRRRSSASQIIPIVSQGLFVATANGLKRSPLAPLDPQFSSILYADFEMAHDDAYQSVRKSSITLTNATRPTPYSQRNLPRRPLPPQQRRTSLPALHPSHDPPPPLPHPISPFELAVPRDEDADIYSRLSTFTFGDAQAPKLQQSVPSSSSRVAVVLDGGESVSPLHRADSFDKTPRPSVAHAHAHAHAQTFLQPSNPTTNGWSSPSEDEEEQRRTNTRSKMRAIDDGMRRPSLPTNDVRQYGSSSGLTATEKGKGKVGAEGENAPQKAQLSSPSLQTEGEGDLELDTDVDLMSVDDTDGRRKARNVGMSDHSSTRGDGRINSDTNSMHGESEGKSRTHDREQKDKNENDMDEDGDDDDGIRAHRKDSSRTWTERTGRRGSLPMDIPYPNNSHSSRTSHSYRDDSYSAEFDARAIAHAQLRRPSRSVDDDLHRAALHLQRKASRVSVAAIGAYEVGAGVTPSSEPDMRGLAMAQAIAQAHLNAQAENDFDGVGAAGASDSPYQGLDLDYILSVSGSMGGGLAGPRPSDAGKHGSDTWSGRISVGSSVAAREGRARDPSWAEGWNVNYGVGRRQSTATVNDDTFLRFVKKHDFSYDERKREWTFARERPEGDMAVTKPGQEIWRCLWVGRYRVDRVHGKNTDPTKPLQMRLNIRHLSDPYSKANTRGGPLTFIHKHSRAQAFSIFRGHTLPQRHLKTNSSILLAPKKVQEQFTTTRTTSKLSTHGLLLDDKNTNATGSGRSGQTASGSGTNSATTSTTSVSGSSRATQSSSTSTSKGSSTEHSQQPSSGSGKLKLRIDRSAEAVDRKGKGTVRSPVNNTPSSSQTSVGEFSPPSTDKGVSDTDVSHVRLRTERSALFDHLRRPMEIDSRSSIAETASLTSEGSQQFSSALSAWDQSSIASSQRPARRPQDLRQQLVRMPAPARGSVGSLEEQPAIRTSHAEAFATLDPPFIEYLRMHSAHYDGSSEQDPSPSRFKGLRKLFHTQPVRNSPKSSPLSSSSSVATLEGHYTPPWLTMAARSKQEEQERVIKNLNDSFRDVGLLPSFKPSRSRANKKGKRSNENIFDQIPDESLYMLLPMWPGETDPASAELSDEPVKLDIPLPDRQFLLVYYVANELSKERSDDKKRSRGSQTSSSTSHHTDATSSRESRNAVSLSSFNVLARLVSYKDVNGSGIRVPTDGLSVTGPMSDAIREIPQIRFQVDDLALMIAFCANRERGVEVVPEGAEKLGLCLPRTSPDPDSDAPLSSLGRAAVEMAWLGALAVMGFGSVA
ncbi:hypothetical protein M0805_003565 [Coniferiporia weirii]|nr:hypothetical protein M0805_003565 [Coniferiporia weirii]